MFFYFAFSPKLHKSVRKTHPYGGYMMKGGGGGGASGGDDDAPWSIVFVP